jgi:hypothetical protein
VRDSDLEIEERGAVYPLIHEGDIVALLRSDGQWRYAGLLVKGGDALEFVVNSSGNTKVVDGGFWDSFIKRLPSRFSSHPPSKPVPSRRSPRSKAQQGAKQGLFRDLDIELAFESHKHMNDSRALKKQKVVMNRPTSERQDWLKDKWFPFVKALKEQIKLVHWRRQNHQYPPAITAAQELFNLFAEQCRVLTEEWYGRGNSCLVYDWSIAVAEAAGQTAYPSGTLDAQQSNDGFVSAIDGLKRVQQGKPFRQRSKEHEAMVPGHTRSTLTTGGTIVPGLMHIVDATCLRSGVYVRHFIAHMLAAHQRIVLKRFARAKRDDFDGFQPRRVREALMLELENMLDDEDNGGGNKTHFTAKRKFSDSLLGELFGAGFLKHSISFRHLLRYGSCLISWTQLEGPRQSRLHKIVREHVQQLYPHQPAPPPSPGAPALTIAEILATRRQRIKKLHEHSDVELVRFVEWSCTHPHEPYRKNVRLQRMMTAKALLSDGWIALPIRQIERHSSARHLLLPWRRQVPLVCFGRMGGTDANKNASASVATGLESEGSNWSMDDMQGSANRDEQQERCGVQMMKVAGAQELDLLGVHPFPCFASHGVGVTCPIPPRAAPTNGLTSVQLPTAAQNGSSGQERQCQQPLGGLVNALDAITAQQATANASNSTGVAIAPTGESLPWFVCDMEKVCALAQQLNALGGVDGKHRLPGEQLHSVTLNPQALKVGVGMCAGQEEEEGGDDSEGGRKATVVTATRGAGAASASLATSTIPTTTTTVAVAMMLMAQTQVHVAVQSAEQCALLALHSAEGPSWCPRLSTWIDIVQVGSSPDACFVRLRTHDVTAKPLLQLLVRMRVALCRDARRRWGDPNMVDFALKVLPEETTGLFHIIFVVVSAMQSSPLPSGGSAPASVMNASVPVQNLSTEEWSDTSTGDSAGEERRELLSCCHIMDANLLAGKLVLEGDEGDDQSDGSIKHRMREVVLGGRSLLETVFDFSRAEGSRQVLARVLEEETGYGDPLYTDAADDGMSRDEMGHTYERQQQPAIYQPIGSEYDREAMHNAKEAAQGMVGSGIAGTSARPKTSETDKRRTRKGDAHRNMASGLLRQDKMSSDETFQEFLASLHERDREAEEDADEESRSTSRDTPDTPWFSRVEHVISEARG